MKRKFKTVQEKEAIVAEYLLGGQTYRQLGKKYNFDYTSIHLWVMEFKGISKPKIGKEVNLVTIIQEKPIVELAQLQEALRKEKLRNELLTTLIDIAEKDLKISIRKKFGTKQ